MPAANTAHVPQIFAASIAPILGLNARIREAMATMAPEDRADAMQFLQQQAVKRGLEKSTAAVRGQIQDAMQPGPNGEEPVLSPEQGMQMLADLEDENRPDVNPAVLERFLMEERATIARERSVQATFLRFHQSASEAIALPAPPPYLNITGSEWRQRQAKANFLLEQWGMNWRVVDPEKALAEISGLMFSPNQHDEVELRKRLLSDLMKDQGFIFMKQAEQAALLDRFARYTLTGRFDEPEEAGPPEAPGGTVRPLEPEVRAELLEVVRAARGTEEVVQAVKAVLERADVEALPEDVKQELSAAWQQRDFTEREAAPEKPELRWLGTSTTEGPRSVTEERSDFSPAEKRKQLREFIENPPKQPKGSRLQRKVTAQQKRIKTKRS
jgi:hypothetical protein